MFDARRPDKPGLTSRLENLHLPVSRKPERKDSRKRYAHANICSAVQRQRVVRRVEDLSMLD